MTDERMRTDRRGAVVGDPSAVVRLDAEIARTRGLESVLDWLVERHLPFDVSHAPDYIPVAGVLANREQGRQVDAIDAIGRSVLGDQYYSWMSGEDGWERGHRDLIGGEVESVWDGPHSLHFACRDNMNYGAWLSRMQELASVLEDEDYKVYWVERSGRIQNAFVPLDVERIQLARDLHAAYVGMIVAERDRARELKRNAPRRGKAKRLDLDETRRLDLTGDRPLPLREARKLKRWWESGDWSVDMSKASPGRFYVTASGRGRRRNSGLPCTIVSLDEDREDHGQHDIYSLLDQVEDLFDDCGVVYDESERLFEACVTDDGRVVGASTLGVYDETPDDMDDKQRPRWSFSVVVDKAHRRKGVARALVKSIMNAKPRDSVLLEGKVVNPYMADLLKSLGFIYYFPEEEGEEWTDHARSWGRRMCLPNPTCWDRLPERERVRLMTRAERDNRAIRRRVYPAIARLGVDGPSVRVLGVARDLTGRVDRRPVHVALLVAESMDDGERMVVPPTSLYDENGRPWKLRLPARCPGYGAWENPSGGRA